MIISLGNHIPFTKYQSPSSTHRSVSLPETFGYQEVLIQVPIDEYTLGLRVYIPFLVYKVHDDLHLYIRELLQKHSVVIILPALTGTSELILGSDEKGTQGAGRANCRFQTGVFVDDIVIGLDYIGSQGLSTTGQELKSMGISAVPCKQQVTLWQEALRLVGARHIKTLIGGSNGGFHVHRRCMQQCDHLVIDHAVVIASPVILSEQEKEFMQIKIDVGENNLVHIPERLQRDMIPLLGISQLFDHCVHQIIKICDVVELSEDERLGVIRMIGFLRFLRPEYYEKFWFSKEGQKLDLLSAQGNVWGWMQKQASTFVGRFSLHGIVALKKSIVDTPDVTVSDYVYDLQQVRVTVVPIYGDTIFDSKSLYALYRELDKTPLFHRLIQIDGMRGGAGHDAFLRPEYAWEFVEGMRG